MLILGRRVGESLRIGDHIDITILSVDAGGNVTIGINAPKDMLILRSELLEATSANQEAATVRSTPQLIRTLGSVLSPGEPPQDSNSN